MNPVVKAQWTAALRSGEYEQGKHYLARGGKFCCLGVLCDLAAKAGVVIERQVVADGKTDYGLERQILGLPVEVQQWAGLDRSEPLVRFKWYDDDPQVAEHAITSLNDGKGQSFDQLADIIDAQL